MTLEKSQEISGNVSWWGGIDRQQFSHHNKESDSLSTQEHVGTSPRLVLRRVLSVRVLSVCQLSSVGGCERHVGEAGDNPGHVQ